MLYFSPYPLSLNYLLSQDNDKLQFKVLVAKKSIQRMKLERA